MKIFPGQKVLEKRREAKLKQLRQIGPFITASLVQIHRKCGKPDCRCAKGEGHPAHLLTLKVEGKTKSIYVPKDLVDEVKEWVNNHKRLKGLTKEISKLSLALLHKQRPRGEGAGQRKNRKSRT